MADVDSKDIEKWIRQVVIKTHKASKSPVCPFAKRTLQDRKIQITPAAPNVLAQIDQCCNLFNVLNLDIVIFYFNEPITEKKLASICRLSHRNNPNTAILYDHPDNDGLHKGVSFSFGKCPLIMVQDLNRLKNAQQQLRKTDYYLSWGLDPDNSMFY